jgi:hypothetical protein
MLVKYMLVEELDLAVGDKIHIQIQIQIGDNVVQS